MTSEYFDLFKIQHVKPYKSSFAEVKALVGNLMNQNQKPEFSAFNFGIGNGSILLHDEVNGRLLRDPD